MELELESLLSVADGYLTCSLDNPVDRCVTFIKKDKYINKLKSLKPLDLIVIVPNGLEMTDHIHKCMRLFRSSNPHALFVLYHNHIHKSRDQLSNDIIDPTAMIHETAVIGVDGINVAIHNGKKILLKHTGNIVIEEDVYIDANSVIHRGVLDSTVIKKGTVIGALTNIGHNVIIGEDCVLTTVISVGGSAIIGNNCWIGMGAIIRNGVTICDDVVIGMGSVVTKDINNPGFYAGNPAKFLKKFDEFDRGF
jgi:acetyltransferase-like isoleucine patch superfamily enzyme